jgi:hypothetical protein
MWRAVLVRGDVCSEKPMLNIFKKKTFTPHDLADQALRILTGQYRKWDVDDYEHYHPKGSKVGGLHAETLGFGLPETWIKLDDVQKSRLQAVIEQIRKVELGA